MIAAMGVVIFGVLQTAQLRFAARAGSGVAADLLPDRILRLAVVLRPQPAPLGAFTVKPFMPTVFGEGKVAQFSTYSYPHWGYGLLMVTSSA